MSDLRLVSRLERLVGFDTQNPPGCETECAAFIAGELAELGFSVERDDFAPGRANIVGRLENGPGPTFAFNTHIDVVPAGEGWTGDPFTLRAHGERLIARGACDAKGPLAAMIEAMALLAADRRSWSGTLLGAFVADEEAASAGARRYASSRPVIDFVVVGEPSGNAPIIAHKGSLRPVVRVGGLSAHSGTPDLGLNAIYQAAKLIPHIEACHARLRERVHPLVGPPSLTVTRVMAGVADNMVPASCELTFDRRMVPGEQEDVALAEIEALLAAIQASEGVELEIAALKPTTGGAAETDAHHPVVLKALAAARRHGVENAQPLGFQGACDFVHFRSIGAEGVVLGPGDLAVAHKPDEFVPRQELIAAALIYADIARGMMAA